MKFEDVTLCILNRNDASSLALLLPELAEYNFDCVFALDGFSTDNSVQLLNEHGIHVYRQDTIGRGSAILQALNLCDTRYIIFLSSDGEEDPKDMPNIYHRLKSGSDLVIASRVLDSTSGFKSDHNVLYYHRKLFLNFITYLINKLFDGRLTDCWNGYRGMRTESALNLKFDAPNFLIEAQTTIRFLKAGLTVSEIPTIERRRFHGRSQNPVFKSGFGHLKLIFTEYFDRKDV